MSPVYVIFVTLKDVARGDATSLAQKIWDENSEELDAEQGDFAVSISSDGFDIGWEPQ